jgi:hypothetical protein
MGLRHDTQRRGEWDIARPFVMLPFGSLSYHGAPAELRDWTKAPGGRVMRIVMGTASVPGCFWTRRT